MIPGPGFGPRPPIRPMPHQMPHQEWDADYLEYGGVGRAPGGPPGMANNQRMPLRRPKNAMPNGNRVGLPVPGGYNPLKTPEKGKKSGSPGAGQPGNDMYKLKTTVQTLEASLSKKNKEIAELKKSRSDDDNSFQNLAEVVARVQALRLNQNPKDDQIIREKVADTARLVRDVHQSLTLLGKKSSDADKAVSMLNQCQEQILTLEDSKPLEVTLDGAKQAVVKYAGSYIMEFNELRSHLDDGCEVLQQVLATDVPGPQIKINVGQLEAQKRKEIVDVATQMAEQWSKEDRKEI